MGPSFPYRRRMSAQIDPAGSGAAGAVELDAAALGRLRDLDPGGRRGFLAQVLRAYESSLIRHLARLAPFVESGPKANAKTAAEVAHTLKSSSASVGALEFSRLCADLERIAKSGESGDILPALVAVLGEGDRVLAAVRAMLRS